MHCAPKMQPQGDLNGISRVPQGDLKERGSNARTRARAHNEGQGGRRDGRPRGLFPSEAIEGKGPAKEGRGHHAPKRLRRLPPERVGRGPGSVQPKEASEEVGRPLGRGFEGASKGIRFPNCLQGPEFPSPASFRRPLRLRRHHLPVCVHVHARPCARGCASISVAALGQASVTAAVERAHGHPRGRGGPISSGAVERSIPRLFPSRRPISSRLSSGPRRGFGSRFGALSTATPRNPSPSERVKDLSDPRRCHVGGLAIRLPLDLPRGTTLPSPTTRQRPDVPRPLTAVASPLRRRYPLPWRRGGRGLRHQDRCPDVAPGRTTVWGARRRPKRPRSFLEQRHG